MASLLAAAVVISRGNSETLAKTLTALSEQQHPLQQVLVVETRNDIDCAELAKSFGFGVVSNTTDQIGSAINAGLDALQGVSNWLWILHHDTAPAPDALRNLARAAEISPSVAVIGPKQLDWNHPIQIRQLGLTTTRSARPFTLVEDEYDQGQFDSAGDTMAVSTAGMLVSIGLWRKLGGIDDGSPSYAQDIEFCIKARALGFRVIVEPSAKLLTLGTLTTNLHPTHKLFGGRAEALAKAHVHLATILWPGFLLPILYLAMPLVVAFSVPLNLLQKRPARIVGQLSAWIFSWFTIPKRLTARARVRDLGSLNSLEKLYATREQIASRREKRFEDEPEPEVRAKGILESGAVWLALVPMLVSFGLIPQGAAVREGLLPPSRSFEAIWASVSSDTQGYLDGVSLPSDPFNWFFGLLGLISPNSPSLAVGWFLFLAPSLMFIGFWLLAGFFSSNVWVRNFISLFAAVLPPFLMTQRAGGIVELTAVTFGVWAVYFILKSATSFNLARAWRWIGLSGLAGAFVAISSPVLFALLGVLTFALGLAKIKRLWVLVWFSLPGLVLLWPWISFVLESQNFVFLTSTSAASLGFMNPYSDFPWLLSLVIVSLLGIVTAIKHPLVGSPIWLFALLAVFASSYQPLAGSHALVLSALLSLTLLVGYGLEHVDSAPLKATGVLALLVSSLTSSAVAVLQQPEYQFVEERQVPALVMAQSDVDPSVRTLKISATGDIFTAELIWGDGRHQNETSLLYDYLQPGSSIESPVAQLAASLIAGNPKELPSLINSLGVDFVLLDPSASGVQIALDSLTELQASGETDFGLLWRVVEPNSGPRIEIEHFEQRELQVGVLMAFVLLAIPTPGSIRGRRLRSAAK